MSHGVAKRPFWLHQLVEYIFGVGLVAFGTQSPTPVVPAVTGLVLMLYAAITKGPLSAFNVLPRGVHRFFDPVMALAMVLAGAQPWADIEFAGRLAMFGMAVVYVVVWWQSSFEEKAPRSSRKSVAPEPASAGAATTAPPSNPSTASSTAAASTAATSTAASSSKTGDRATDIGRTAGRVVGTGVTMFRKARAKAKQQE